MNNKGFAISGILYSILIIFVVSIAIMLFNLQNRKTILDEIKVDAVEAVNFDSSIDYLTERINALEEEINILKTTTSSTNKVLLWENSSPSIKFEAQTIELDLSSYNFVIVGYSINISNPSWLKYEVIPINSNNTIYINWILGNTFPSRTIVVSENGISFGDGFQYTTSGTTVTNDGLIIPIEIYAL